MKPEIFRERVISPNLQTNKTALVKFALRVSKETNKPITNGEFVYDLMVYKFGAIIEKLRKSGWIIHTLKTEKSNVYEYKLVAEPNEDFQLFNT